MDGLTHAVGGLALAAPLVEYSPVAAGALVFGSVLPDVDVVWRFFGKKAYLRAHRTWTHSIGGAVIACALTWLIFRNHVLYHPLAPPALGAGILIHCLLDLCNSYGTAILTPFSGRRFALESIFLVDSVFTAASIAALFVLIPAWRRLEFSPVPAIWFGGLMVVYPAMRIAMRCAAGRYVPDGTRSLVPTTLLPWRYLGYRPDGDRVHLFEFSLLSRQVMSETYQEILDDQYRARLEQVPEYRLMCELTDGYHVTGASEDDDGLTLTCHDLRLRNFGGRFGRLDVVFDECGAIIKKVFHV
jgi:membrane-bound metal-dependent hydrolase YbcI (DUF457 family)